MIAGGFGIRGFEGKIAAANFLRKNDIPTLGICFGFQAMVIDFCRHELNIPDANSKEFSDEIESKNWVIIDMPDASTV